MFYVLLKEYYYNIFVENEWIPDNTFGKYRVFTAADKEDAYKLCEEANKNAHEPRTSQVSFIDACVMEFTTREELNYVLDEWEEEHYAYPE